MIDPFDMFDTDMGADATPRRIPSTRQRASEESIRQVSERIEKLTLINMALWSLLQDKLGLTEAQLLERVTMIDMMDGKTDGKAQRGIAKCPRRSRTMSPRHNRCLYCGHEKLVQSAFDKL